MGDERVAMIKDLHREWERINGMVQTANEDFAELFAMLNKHGVRYVIVGGYAFVFYVKTRYTKDLDLLVEPSHDNATRLIRAIDDFGFGSFNLTPHAFAEGQV